MPGYQTKQQSIAITGAADLTIRSLLDVQQFSDPFGDANDLGISSATWPLFGLLWPSGSHLAARMAARVVRPAESVLEIGCGLALASLVAHRRGADVTACDYHPLAETFLLENLRLNGLGPMKYAHGPWSNLPRPYRRSDAPVLAPVTGVFDLLVGSDLLYERDVAGDLAGFVARHAAPVCEVWIADPDRGNRPAFNRRMSAEGFTRQEERLDCTASASSPAYKGRMLLYRRDALPVGR